jgi:hypothetical protein
MNVGMVGRDAPGKIGQRVMAGNDGETGLKVVCRYRSQVRQYQQQGEYSA